LSTEYSGSQSRYQAVEKDELDKLSSLDSFLLFSNLDPLGAILTRPWDSITNKTRAYYTNKAGNIISEILRIVAPESPASLWNAIKSTDDVSKQLDDSKLGDEFLLAISESYKH
jgi:hypothetical protein